MRIEPIPGVINTYRLVCDDPELGPITIAETWPRGNVFEVCQGFYLTQDAERYLHSLQMGLTLRHNS
jgi:hypothetical protein